MRFKGSVDTLAREHDLEKQSYFFKVDRCQDGGAIVLQ